jgi:hypothetical protein
MQKDRGKDFKVFLSYDQMNTLQRLGFNASSAKYKWAWPGELRAEPLDGELYLNNEIPPSWCNLESPTFSFQELLRLLPTELDIPVPEYLESAYMCSPVKTENGKNYYKHYLNIEFLEGTEEIVIGYREEFFESVSPRYPFPECPENPEDQFMVLTERGGIISGPNWLNAVYDLIIKLLQDGLCKFS